MYVMIHNDFRYIALCFRFQKKKSTACGYIYGKGYMQTDGFIITDPKTPCSIRTITMPEFLNDEIKEYIGMLYGIGDNDRIFGFNISFIFDLSSY